MKRKWMWITVTVALALIASFAVTAQARGFSPLVPGWSGWCSLCDQHETQSYDVRYEGQETCLYVVWFADDTRAIAHESLAYCTPGKAPIGPFELVK